MSDRKQLKETAYACCNYGPVRQGRVYNVAHTGRDYRALKVKGNLVYTPEYVFQRVETKDEDDGFY